MSKYKEYKEALNELKTVIHDEFDETKSLNSYLDKIKTLQELADKATPKKPIDGMTGRTFEDAHKCKLCPNCKGKGPIIKKKWKYCPECGQSLDRED